MSGTQILWKKDRATHLTVRLIQGTSSVQYLNLQPGSSVGPLRVGTSADWCVVGEGVQPLHLSLLFDGTDLFVAAASPTVYVSVNGQPVNAGQWVPVGVSSEIAFGSALLHVARGELQAPPGTALHMPPADNGPETTLSDGGRLREMAEKARISGNQPGAHSPAAVQASAPAPAVMPSPAAGQPPAPAPAPVPTPEFAKSAPPAPPAKKASAWSETSLVKKITLFLLPLAAVGTWFTWDDPAPAPRKAKRKPPAVSASAPGRSSAAALAPSGAPATPTTPVAPAPAGSHTAQASASPAASSVKAAPSAIEGAAPTGSAAILTFAPGSSDTTPRAAIDAAFAGRLETAKELYAKLAAAHPDKPEFSLAKKRVEENAVRKP